MLHQFMPIGKRNFQVTQKRVTETNIVVYEINLKDLC